MSLGNFMSTTTGKSTLETVLGYIPGGSAVSNLIALTKGGGDLGAALSLFGIEIPIKFFFEVEGVAFQLPVNPEKIAITTQGSNQVKEIVKLGDINILREKKLKTLDIESFFPATVAPYVETKMNLLSPETHKKLFNTLQESKLPCKLVISGLNVSMQVSIESFSWEMRAADPDVYYKLSLKEYRPYGIKKLTSTTQQNPTTTTPVLTTPIGLNSNTSRPKTGFAVGDTVVANGKYWYDSYGSEPFGNFKNFTGKISKIVNDKTRGYGYHITTPDGGWRGWVSASQLSHK